MEGLGLTRRRSLESEILTYVYAIAVWVGEDEALESEVGVSDSLSDLDLVLLKVSIQRGCVLDHQVRDVLNSRFVTLEKRQVKLSGLLLKDDETHGGSILEDLRKTEYLCIERDGAVDIGDGDGWRDSAKKNSVRKRLCRLHGALQLCEAVAKVEAVLNP
jgi:hypothetical protein